MKTEKEKRLYKGYKDRCIFCKLGFHKPFTFRRDFIIKSDEFMPLLSKQIEYFRKHGEFPKDKEKRLFACSCGCGCGKEKLRN